jgi:hypothetical protein
MASASAVIPENHPPHTQSAPLRIHLVRNELACACGATIPAPLGSTLLTTFMCKDCTAKGLRKHVAESFRKLRLELKGLRVDAEDGAI